MATASLSRPLLLAYDGSNPARGAIDRAAELWPGASAIVATVWTSAAGAAAAGRSVLSSTVVHEALERLDEAAERAAGATAEDGVRAAAARGLRATPLTVRAQENVWSALDRTAEEHDVAAVVVGGRGQSELHAFLLGSVTHGLVHHSRRPVVVVRGESEG